MFAALAHLSLLIAGVDVGTNALTVALRAVGPALPHCAVAILVVPMLITAPVAVVPAIEIAQHLW